MRDARNHRFWLAVVIIACLGLYLIGNGRAPLWDRDEGWYAQCSKQMWESGDWVVPRFLDQLRAQKPPLVYWLQMGGYWLFGGPSEFAARLYSAIAQTLVLCITGYSIWRLVGPSRAAWTVLVYGTCIMSIMSAKMCLTDATMMVFVVTAQMCLMSFYLGRFSWPRLLLMFVALGFAGLTKGPMGLMPTVMTAAALLVMEWRRWCPIVRPANLQFWNRLLLWLAVLAGGLVIIAGVSAPWVITLNLREPKWLPAVLNIAHEHVAQSLHGHSGFFGYYLVTIWVTYFPWTLLLVTAAYIGWRQRHTPQIRFAFVAFVGPWLALELMRTKLPHYMLPTYPFVSLVVADCIVRCARRQYREMSTRRFMVWLTLGVVPVGLVASIPWLALLPSRSLGPLPYMPMAVLSLLGFVLTAGTWWFFHQRKPLWACGWLGGSFIVVIAVAYGWVVPQCSYLRTPERVAGLLASCGGLADQAPVGDVAAISYFPKGKERGYWEPTLAYYQGGSIRTIEVDRYLEQTPIDRWPRVLVLTDEVWAVLDQRTRDHLRQVGTVRGFRYNGKGGVVDVIVATRELPKGLGQDAPHVDVP